MILLSSCSSFPSVLSNFSFFNDNENFLLFLMGLWVDDLSASLIPSLLVDFLVSINNFVVPRGLLGMDRKREK